MYMIAELHQYKCNIIWKNTCDMRFWKWQLIKGLFDHCFLVGWLPIQRCQKDLKIRHGSSFWSNTNTNYYMHINMLCVNVQVFASYFWEEQRFPQKSLSRAYIKSLEKRLACCIQAHTSGNSPPQTWSQEERGLLSKCASIWLVITFSVEKTKQS